MSARAAKKARREERGQLAQAIASLFEADTLAYKLTVTAMEPFCGYAAEDPQPILFPDGYMISAQTNDFPRPRKIDSVKLKSILEQTLKEVGINEMDIQRTSQGLWMNRGTMLRLASQHIEPEEFVKKFNIEVAWAVQR